MKRLSHRDNLLENKSLEAREWDGTVVNVIWYMIYLLTAIGLSPGGSSAVHERITYEGWNFNIGNYLFTTDTK